MEWAASEGDPATGKGANFSTKWDEPGDYTVTAKCGKTSFTARVTVVRITFGHNRIKTGFTVPAGTSTVSARSYLMCEPPHAVSDIHLTIGGMARATVEDGERIPETGYMSFRVKGKAETPPTVPGGTEPKLDTFVRARIKGTTITCDQVPVVVVVPKRIDHCDQQNAAGNVAPENLVLDRGTSPVIIDTPPGMKTLVTAWLHWLTVSVEDQFGDPLDEMYKGARVTEKASNGEWYDIQQPLTAEGTYTDPVGVYDYPKKDPYFRQVREGSDAARDWPGEDKLSMPPMLDPQRIPVQIGGHDVGQVQRDVVGVPSNNHVNVEWLRPANCP